MRNLQSRVDFVECPRMVLCTRPNGRRTRVLCQKHDTFRDFFIHIQYFFGDKDRKGKSEGYNADNQHQKKRQLYRTSIAQHCICQYCLQPIGYQPTRICSNHVWPLWSKINFVDYLWFLGHLMCKLKTTDEKAKRTKITDPRNRRYFQDSSSMNNKKPWRQNQSTNRNKKDSAGISRSSLN